MVERDKVGFISVPWSAVPSSQPGSMAIMFDKVSRHLPPPARAVVVSGTHAPDPDGEAEGVVYHRIPDRWDRGLFKALGRVHGLVPGMGWDYHFRSYFHRTYALRGAAIMAQQGVGTIVFPLYPQWAPIIKTLNPQARLILWMQCEWLSAGPAYYGSCLEAVDRIVCCSDYIADKIAQRFPEAGDRLRTVPNGVDTKLFAPSSSRCRHQILHAGRLTPEKGAHVLLEAFEKILIRYPDAQLILAGPFWVTPAGHLIGAPQKAIRSWRRLGKRYEYRIRRKAEELKGVFLTGHIGHRELARIYRTASVFVHPSLWNEPFGMILAEAMASGLPVVASRSGGIPEVIQDGRTGILNEPGDVDGLVKAVERLFENRDLAARMGLAGRARAEETYHWDGIAAQVAEIIREP